MLSVKCVIHVVVSCFCRVYSASTYLVCATCKQQCSKCNSLTGQPDLTTCEMDYTDDELEETTPEKTEKHRSKRSIEVSIQSWAVYLES